MGHPMTPRREDWPARLAAFIESRRKAVFCWGEQDCWLFCADWVAEATGSDPLARFRGRYHDRASALRLLWEERGSLDPVAAVSSLDQPLPAPLLARRGDIVAIATPDGPALGICLGDGIAALTEADGLTFLPLGAALAAWRV